MPENARLRIHGQGEVEVELVTRYLADLAHAYNSVLVFETMIDGLRRASRDYPFPLRPFGPFPGWLVVPRRGSRYVNDWPPTSAEIASLVPRSEQLVLASVRLSSPGFWDFLGKLNPLEVIRQYMNDRHERRKDREYRESAEARRLLLENLQRENEVLAGRIRIARELGATERDLAPLLNELIYRPLTALDSHQDKHVIEKAEIPRLPDHHDE